MDPWVESKTGVTKTPAYKVQLNYQQHQHSWILGDGYISIQRIQCQGLTAISNLLDIIGLWPVLADGDDANSHHDLLGTAGVCLATWRSAGGSHSLLGISVARNGSTHLAWGGDLKWSKIHSNGNIHSFIFHVCLMFLHILILEKVKLILWNMQWNHEEIITSANIRTFSQMPETTSQKNEHSCSFKLFSVDEIQLVAP